MPGPFKRASSLACAAALALGASACATAVSTSSFKGESKDVAQTIKNLQSDVTAGEQKKVCQNDLAHAVVAKLDSSHGGCQQAIKDQLAEIGDFEVTIHSISVAGATATARVTSKYSGKSHSSTLSLLKEGGKWKVSALG
jgi:hypothetical protein